MRRIHSIRLRVTVAFLAAGALISALFAIATYIWAHDIELRYIDATMGEQLRYIIEQTEQNPNLSPPATHALRGYVTTPGVEEALPAYLLGLGPGIYERDHEGREYHIMVQDAGSRRFYLTYDASLIEPFETLLHNFLIGAGSAFAFLALFLGYWLSGRVIAPVTQLAHEVKRSRVDTGHVVRFANYGNDEVGDLARTFERYSLRLQAFAQREAAFTAEVAHELRNQLFVMGSCIELLLSRQPSGEKTDVHLVRLQRGVHEMGDLLDVLLILAREPHPAERETTEISTVEPVLRNVVDSRRTDLERKNLKVEFSVDGDAETRAPDAVLNAVLGSLLDNAIAAADKGEIVLVLDENGVTIADTAASNLAYEQPYNLDEGIRANTASEGERSLGLSIVKRLCERYGWRIEVRRSKKFGSTARLILAD